MDARDEDQAIHALMENMLCSDELDWLTMCYYCEVKNYPEEYCPPMSSTNPSRLY